MSNYYAVIMAGGIGSRFWPVSTQKYPKQFHDLLGTGTSLLEHTFNRLSKFIPIDQIFIATNDDYKELVIAQLKLSERQVILEPDMRNTAPCILYATLKIKKENPNAVMLIAPADHWIEDEMNFENAAKLAFEACEKADILMTLGIEPTNPNTGYGYIKYEKQSSSAIKKVSAFVEKPNVEKAKEFIKDGNYVWNAGIFLWSVESILNAYKNHLPEMFKLLDAGNESYNTKKEKEFVALNYPVASNISIDYGIMQKADNIYTLPVDFDWNDLGTWGSLYSKLNKDNDKNAVLNAEVIFSDASNNIIRTNKGKKVVIQGLNDFIIIEKDDVLLICPKSQEQDIKQLVTKVKDKFGSDLG